MKKYWPVLLLLCALLGLFDSGYLAYEHFQKTIPPCSANSLLGDCGTVLRSSYSVVIGIPLALIGFVHYTILSFVLLTVILLHKRSFVFLAIVMSCIGFVSSLYFVYLQLFVIHALCVYCMVSAATSTLLFLGILFYFAKERKQLTQFIIRILYVYVLKQILFLLPPERVHTNMVHFGERVGSLWLFKKLAHFLFVREDKSLSQSIAGVYFKNPIGLAAGFDYEARLTQTLDGIGFGFQTVGTITNRPYKGNPSPMLGRLPKSKSLMVNKGFKNLGATKTIDRLKGLVFPIPVGISIGKTNTPSVNTVKKSIDDIVRAFILFERSNGNHSYYELNISCPNLLTNVSFYPPQNLNRLLTAIDSLHITRPIFIKMPIEKSNKEVLSMLEVISKHSVTGVIFGNLQKDRSHPALNQSEVSKFPKGNFSGKPTFDRSNELISLTYKHYKKRLTIIGCGGVFNAHDAYEKITRGASLVQLITGMIFEGPQLVANINTELPDLLKKNGFRTITEAIGSASKKAKK